MKLLYVIFATLLVTACSGNGDNVAPEHEQGSLLLPPGSNEAFVAHIRAGLEQWAGLAESSDTLLQTVTGSPGTAMLQADAAVTLAASQEAAAPTFSETNVLVAGVDEIDRVRYDGSKLYLANQDRVQVVDTSTPPGAIVETVRVSSQDNTVSQGLYHYKTSARSILANIRSTGGYLWFESFFAPWGWDEETDIDFLDVDNGASIAEQLEIDGNYVNSRRVGNMLYVITRHTPAADGIIPFADTEAEKDINRALLDQLDINDVLPRVRFADGTEVPLVTTAECFLPDMSGGEPIYYPTITTVTAFDMTSPEDFSSLCMSEGVYGMHVSPDAVYLAAYRSSLASDGYYTDTVIHKLGIAGGAPTYVASGRIPGTFWGDPAFLMGEHDGNLAAVTTTFDRATPVHHLTVLHEASTDFELEVVGQIPNSSRAEPIGKPGEQIYASRIVGNRAFIVTFRQIDPVYLVDLANPADPFIAGELEIPGFSSYLHPVTDSLLLGVGKDAVTENGVPWFQGLNVRLFDVAVPSEMQVLADFGIGKRGTDSAVLWDPHAFTVLDQGDTQRIAIPVRVAGAHVAQSGDASRYYPWTENALYLFEVDETARSLSTAGKIVAEDAGTGERYQPGCCSWNDRSFINGDTVHFLDKSRLLTAAWSTPDETVNLFIPSVFINPEEEVSTTEQREGLDVWLRDRISGEQITCADARAIDGDFEAELKTDCAGDETLGLFERAGSYAVEVDADGYLPWRGEDVRVQADQHHVGTTYVNIYLSPQ